MTKHLPKLSLLKYAYFFSKNRTKAKKVNCYYMGKMNEQDFQKYSAISNEMMATKKQA